ncbi:MAG: MBL fold metallo-hydrolase [Acidobacteriia bacterium]|nr:MBL fold metallo-hydrolase [Terriglobia bacterium]
MTTIDVGQGDSIFLALPDGRRLLVDGGGIPSYGGQRAARLDIGEDVVAPYLWNRGIRTVDVIAASHGHEDHIGGLAALVADFHPKELWTGAMPDTPAWRRLRDAAGRGGVTVTAMQAGRRFSWGGAAFDVLAPFPGYTPSDTARNNDSLVMRVRYGRHAFLLTGDIERQVEWEMLDAHEVQPANVVKIPHHGSRTSSTEQFLAAVAPSFAVISAGFENSYGDPHEAVLERLAERRAMVLRTDQEGLVSIRSDGRRLYVETGRRMAARAVTPAW